MIKHFLKLVFFIIVSVVGQKALLDRLKIVNPNEYFTQVAQRTIYEVEKKEWCSFKLADFNQTLNEITHTNMLVTGEVRYFNGFLVSIEKIDVSTISDGVNSRTINNVTVTTATVKGNINFRDARVGYDVLVSHGYVLANVNQNNKQRRYTGIFTHSLIQGSFSISKNMNTNEISLVASVISASAGSGVRMIYKPADEISEILSLRFLASSSLDSADRWMRDLIGPIMLNIATNKIQFPEVCFNC